MLLFSTDTQIKVSRETGKFTAQNYDSKIKELGGFNYYVTGLGGVFTRYHEWKKKADNYKDFQGVAEYVFGLLSIFRFAYWNGSTWWYYLNSPQKCFYNKKITDKGCRGGSISQLCKGEDGRLRITNCNYGVDTFLKALGWYKYSCADKRWLSSGGGKKVTAKNKLQPGDIVHLYRSGKWHHVVMVYKIEDGKVWCLDFGNRYIKTGKPLHYMVVNDSTACGGEYGTDKFVGWHIIDLKEAPKVKTNEDKAVELKREIENFLIAKKREYGAEVYNLAQDYMIDREAYLRACADYVLNGYAGSGEARKAFFGEDYDAVQEKVNWVIQTAKDVIDGRYGTGETRKELLGKDYDVVQAEVNRLLKG